MTTEFHITVLGAHAAYTNGDKQPLKELAADLTKEQIYEATKIMISRYKSVSSEYVLECLQLLTHPIG